MYAATAFEGGLTQLQHGRRHGLVVHSGEEAIPSDATSSGDQQQPGRHNREILHVQHS
jgi:hypothetical protein